MAQLERAIQEDPLNLIMLATRGMLLVSTNRREEAELALRKTLDLDERYWPGTHLHGDLLTSSPHWARLARLMNLPKVRL